LWRGTHHCPVRGAIESSLHFLTLEEETMIEPSTTIVRVVGGGDTHKDTHTAAVLDATGKLLGHSTFPASASGYEGLLQWLHGFGSLERLGVEGTGSYGSGLAAHLRAKGVDIIEVNRPNRQSRRRHGKSSRSLSVISPRKALHRASASGENCCVPKPPVLERT
jgi:hypothetical protein